MSKQELLNLLTAGEAERPRGAAARKPPLVCASSCTCHPFVYPLDCVDMLPSGQVS